MLPVTVSGIWYHLQIVGDTGSQRVRNIVDGTDTGWLDGQGSWSMISSMTLRENYNYPAISRYDDLILASYSDLM